MTICEALATLADRFTDVDFIYPVHPNPNVRQVAHDRLGQISNIHLLEPLAYTHLVCLLKASYLVLSDSGGLQEEAPALAKPVLVMREVTERPEGVEAGVNYLVGSATDAIVAKVTELLTNTRAYDAMAKQKNPFGDGTTGQHIASIIMESLR
jgi:UDP-N-acetylglucosamine 2-epimerase (non-hydrolysing)